VNMALGLSKREELASDPPLSKLDMVALSETAPLRGVADVSRGSQCQRYRAQGAQ